MKQNDKKIEKQNQTKYFYLHTVCEKSKRNEIKHNEVKN